MYFLQTFIKKSQLIIRIILEAHYQVTHTSLNRHFYRQSALFLDSQIHKKRPFGIYLFWTLGISTWVLTYQTQSQSSVIFQTEVSWLLRQRSGHPTQLLWLLWLLCVRGNMVMSARSDRDHRGRLSCLASPFDRLAPKHQLEVHFPLSGICFLSRTGILHRCKSDRPDGQRTYAAPDFAGR